MIKNFKIFEGKNTKYWYSTSLPKKHLEMHYKDVLSFDPEDFFFLETRTGDNVFKFIYMSKAEHKKLYSKMNIHPDIDNTIEKLLTTCEFIEDIPEYIERYKIEKEAKRFNI